MNEKNDNNFYLQIKKIFDFLITFLFIFFFNLKKFIIFLLYSVVYALFALWLYSDFDLLFFTEIYIYIYYVLLKIWFVFIYLFLYFINNVLSILYLCGYFLFFLTFFLFFYVSIYFISLVSIFFYSVLGFINFFVACLYIFHQAFYCFFYIYSYVDIFYLSLDLFFSFFSFYFFNDAFFFYFSHLFLVCLPQLYAYFWYFYVLFVFTVAKILQMFLFLYIFVFQNIISLFAKLHLMLLLCFWYFQSIYFLLNVLKYKYFFYFTLKIVIWNFVINCYNFIIAKQFFISLKDLFNLYSSSIFFFFNYYILTTWIFHSVIWVFSQFLCFIFFIFFIISNTCKILILCFLVFWRLLASAFLPDFMHYIEYDFAGDTSDLLTEMYKPTLEMRNRLTLSRGVLEVEDGENIRMRSLESELLLPQNKKNKNAAYLPYTTYIYKHFFSYLQHSSFVFFQYENIYTKDQLWGDVNCVETNKVNKMQSSLYSLNLLQGLLFILEEYFRPIFLYFKLLSPSSNQGKKSILNDGIISSNKGVLNLKKLHFLGIRKDTKSSRRYNFNFFKIRSKRIYQLELSALSLNKKYKFSFFKLNDPFLQILKKNQPKISYMTYNSSFFLADYTKNFEAKIRFRSFGLSFEGHEPRKFLYNFGAYGYSFFYLWMLLLHDVNHVEWSLIFYYTLGMYTATMLLFFDLSFFLWCVVAFNLAQMVLLYFEDEILDEFLFDKPNIWPFFKKWFFLFFSFWGFFLLADGKKKILHVESLRWFSYFIYIFIFICIFFLIF